MKLTYSLLLILHVVLVFAVGIWLLFSGNNTARRIPKGFLPLTLFTMVTSLAMMQVNWMQHDENASVQLLSPYKYGLKTLVFAFLIAIVYKNYKKASITNRTWQLMIGLMAIDLLITGVWM